MHSINIETYNIIYGSRHLTSRVRGTTCEWRLLTQVKKLELLSSWFTILLWGLFAFIIGQKSNHPIRIYGLLVISFFRRRRSSKLLLLWFWFGFFSRLFFSALAMLYSSTRAPSRLHLGSLHT